MEDHRQSPYPLPRELCPLLNNLIFKITSIAAAIPIYHGGISKPNLPWSINGINGIIEAGHKIHLNPQS